MSDRTPSTFRERMASPLTWHYIGAILLAVLVAGLAVRLGLDWSAVNGRSVGALADKQLEKRSLELQTAPLRGLDERVDLSRAQIQGFYSRRVPASYSFILERIGDLEVKSGVRLSRVLYTQGPPGTDLTEISMDSVISGEYPQIMRFINGLEHDQTFFVIRSMGLTGQQGGQVNLRLRVSTWLRPADAASSGLPQTGSQPATNEQAPAVSAKEGE